MPPQGVKRPDQATYRDLTSWLETQLDRAAELSPYPGRPVVHRLNRSEYANAIRDLLALDIDPAALLPPDDSAYGFDNISDALGVSPSLEEHYLSAALKIGALAVGNPNVTPGSETWRIRQDLSQDQHIEGTAARNHRGHAGSLQFSAGWRIHAPGQALPHQFEHHARAWKFPTRWNSVSTASACTLRPSAARTIWRGCFRSPPIPETRWMPACGFACP